jgi:hypothetical protein
MDFKLYEYGWELIPLSINTKKYNRLYKTAKYKENMENNIDIKYHLNLWVLDYISCTYFICEFVNSNFGLYKAKEDLDGAWDVDSEKIIILKSNVKINEIINYIKSETIFSKQYLREFKINNII